MFPKNAQQFRGMTLLHAALHSAYFRCWLPLYIPNHVRPTSQLAGSGVGSEWASPDNNNNNNNSKIKHREALFSPPSGVHVLRSLNWSLSSVVRRGVPVHVLSSGYLSPNGCHPLLLLPPVTKPNSDHLLLQLQAVR